MDTEPKGYHKSWKVVTPYSPTCPVTSCLEFMFIGYKGMSALPNELLVGGWKIDLVFNRATQRRKLYIRHPELRLIGRATVTQHMIEHEETIKLDYLVQEHNHFIKNVRVVDDDGEFLDPEEDQEKILMLIYNTIKKKLKPKAKPSADIIDIIKRRAS